MAIALGDPDLIRSVVEHNPKALHFTISLARYDILDLLISLGADIEAEDGSGNTALVSAMMRGDLEAIRRLHAACRITAKGVPMIRVPDVGKTLDWYVSIGFEGYGPFGTQAALAGKKAGSSATRTDIR